MIDKFKTFIAVNRLINETDNVLLAVSGGIDSMVMTNLFLRADLKFGIAHCNFGLRGAESDGDEEFVKDYALERGIPFHVKKFDTTAYSKKNGLSIQMAARELRYTWFESLLLKHGFTSIALAHNLNDNIETFLINLARGTGIAGLTGIKPRNNNLIRPLLFASRHIINEYSYEYEVPYREDSSNAETKYVRNKIRHILLPLLKEINPSIEKTLNDTILRVSEINEIYVKSVSEIRTKLTTQKGNLISFKVDDLKKTELGKTLIYELFKNYGIGNMQLDDLISVINGPSGKMINTLTHRIIKNRDEILITTNEKDEDIRYLISDITGFLNVPGLTSAFITVVSAGYGAADGKTIACLDAEKILYPVTIRKWHSGDSFYPLGMKQKKKLSDYFIDNKLSIPEKEACMILESDGKIAWVIGNRIDNRFKVTKSTKNILNILFTEKMTDPT